MQRSLSHRFMRSFRPKKRIKRKLSRQNLFSTGENNDSMMFKLPLFPLTAIVLTPGNFNENHQIPRSAASNKIT